MKLLIIRHATPDYKNKTIKPRGHLEAQALAAKLSKIGIDKIYASPMGRAQHTMQYTSDATGVPCTTQEWMQELVDWRLPDRQWPWKVHSDMVFDEAGFKDYANWYDSPIYQGVDIKGKFLNLKEKSDEFLFSLGYRREGNRFACVNPSDENIAVFCHAGFGSAWAAHLLNIPFSMIATCFPMRPTGVTYIEFKGNQGDTIYPNCLRFGDTSHIDHTDLSYID
ncbi:histidine phosphatase family protein [Vallitalea okinawensis]|uniref:histidine phosphatase family protein n=1 Tax=Vallitalea okinawensis TaxID=2078660 RepID=UPI000CFB1E5E|nr:histidine phosphatase family protein [Vallitalea okinawensis]